MNRGFPSVSQLNTTFADAAIERQRAEEEAEPMDWDSVDPGLMRQLHDCRKSSAALKGPIAAEEILAKVGIGSDKTSPNIQRQRYFYSLLYLRKKYLVTKFIGFFFANLGMFWPISRSSADIIHGSPLRLQYTIFNFILFLL